MSLEPLARRIAGSLARLGLLAALAAPNPALAAPAPQRGSETGAAAPAAQRGFRGEFGPNTVFVPRVDTPPRLEDFVAMRPTLEVRRQYGLVEGFTQRTPTDGAAASQPTQVLLGYDDEALHVVFLAFDDSPGDIRARMSRREDIGADDHVWITLDPFRDQQRGYEFTVNPLGIQRDALWTEGQEEPDFSFDTLWHSEGRVTDQGYVVVMSIPFKSLRFPREEIQTWGIVLARWVPRGAFEESYWPPVSNRVEGILNQAGAITGLHDVSPGRNVRLIPYGTFRSFRALDANLPGGPDFVRDPADPAGGLDAKMVLKDSLVVDATFNPDFSQVESDQPQNTVNQRFEVFFPEKRPFFLENANYFTTPINLMFTRRIADPRVGLRTTGKIGRWAVGALGIDDRAAGLALAPTHPDADGAARVGAVRIARDIGAQSRLGAIWIDRSFAGARNRVTGLDGRFKLHTNWVAEFQAVATDSVDRAGNRSSGPGYTATLARVGRVVDYRVTWKDFDENFRADIGFVPRVGIRQLEQEAAYKIWTDGDLLQRWGPQARYVVTWDREGNRLDTEYNPWVAFHLAGQTRTGVYTWGARVRLRPIDYPVLDSDLELSNSVYGFWLNSQLLPWLEFGTWHDIGGTRINFVPAPGRTPALADGTAGELQVDVRPNDRLRTGVTWLYTGLNERDGGPRILRSDIFRGRVDYQLNRELSLRVIAQYEVLDTDPTRTRLPETRSLNADVLATYLLNPWTSLYVGYNRNAQNLELLSQDGVRTLRRTGGRLLPDANQVFVKVSYLFAY